MTDKEKIAKYEEMVNILARSSMALDQIERNHPELSDEIGRELERALNSPLPHRFDVDNI